MERPTEVPQDGMAVADDPSGGTSAWRCAYVTVRVAVPEDVA